MAKTSPDIALGKQRLERFRWPEHANDNPGPVGEDRPHEQAVVSRSSTHFVKEIPALATLGNSRPATALVITASMLVGALVWLRSPQAFLMVGLSGVFGALCESLPIRAGAWHYPDPAFLGMPCWLPTGYSLFGFALVQVGSGLAAVWSLRRNQTRALAA